MAKTTEKAETKVTEMENKIEKILSSWLTIKSNASISKKWKTSITPLSSVAAWK